MQPDLLCHVYILNRTYNIPIVGQLQLVQGNTTNNSCIVQ